MGVPTLSSVVWVPIVLIYSRNTLHAPPKRGSSQPRRGASCAARLGTIAVSRKRYPAVQQSKIVKNDFTERLVGCDF